MIVLCTMKNLVLHNAMLRQDFQNHKATDHIRDAHVEETIKIATASPDLALH